MKVGDTFTRTGTSFGDNGTVYTHEIEITKVGPKRVYFAQTVSWNTDGEANRTEQVGSWFLTKNITADGLPPAGGYSTHVDGEWTVA